MSWADMFRKGGRFSEALQKLEQKSLEQRRVEIKKITFRSPDSTPVIVIPENGIRLDKMKYVCPSDVDVGRLNYIVTKKIQSATPNTERAYFFFTEGKQIPPTSQLIKDLCAKNKNEDFSLHLYLTAEETFGFSFPIQNEHPESL